MLVDDLCVAECQHLLFVAIQADLLVSHDHEGLVAR